ncbi:MAG: hypothetical protein NUV91_02185 [Candidatus Omnitrophica bacterium]|nr:hypothetical protein [Candidatus Omnitrophota bacterium]
MRILLFILPIFLISCSSTRNRVEPGTVTTESSQEIESALTTVVGGMSGQNIDREDLYHLGKKLRKDKETQLAVNAVVQTMQGNVVVKYCPVDGERFHAKMEICPTHHVELKTVEE